MSSPGAGLLILGLATLQLLQIIFRGIDLGRRAPQFQRRIFARGIKPWLCRRSRQATYAIRLISSLCTLARCAPSPQQETGVTRAWDARPTTSTSRPAPQRLRCLDSSAGTLEKWKFHAIEESSSKATVWTKKRALRFPERPSRFRQQWQAVRLEALEEDLQRELHGPSVAREHGAGFVEDALGRLKHVAR